MFAEIDELLADVRRDRRMVETDLAQRAAALVNNMRRLLDRVAAGDRVNRLGEVQGLGPEVDGLCRDLERIRDVEARLALFISRHRPGSERSRPGRQQR
jgi:hypothetical protein